MTTLERALRRIDAAVIGTSAGGVDALATLLHDLPQPWHLPLVTVIHLPERRESRLVEVFAQRLSIPVREAEDKAPVAAGTLYFAPPSYHLSIEHSREFSLSCEPPVLWSRPSIDLLMASAADAYGPDVAGLLLTGANADGAAGLRRIHAAGGFTAVQEPSEAEVDTMPRAALALHTPDRVLPLHALRTLLMEFNALHAD
ncbi:chemotaxis protein CheB [Variovorax sp. ZT4R33]|uniref:chemotaxis protein CheB n=1 Tax=Variovorax sp. ZT4R33 TaxID=3443743 RepID=UPI003F490161